jgi:hypothetical protein
MSKPSAARISEAFTAADNLSDDETSTEFLIALVADTLGISYGEVVDGLAATYAKEKDMGFIIK